MVLASDLQRPNFLCKLLMSICFRKLAMKLQEHDFHLKYVFWKSVSSREKRRKQKSKRMK